jgi:CubicO group peptidase (beta-lactamase class C family)
MTRFATATRVLDEAVRARAFPAAVVEVGCQDAVLWQEAIGTLGGAADATCASVFDLASLTKVVCTTTLAMRAVDDRRLRLDEPVAERLPAWRGTDRSDVTVRDLLAHASGLTAYLPFFRDHRGRAELERAICTMSLEYPPRSRSVYSDLGFILLGFLLEDVAGEGLAAQFDQLVARHGWGEVRFCPPASWRDRTAPTEVDPWRGRLLVGEVHDENAWALGGVAGHSGLFGTAGALGRFARTMLAGFRGSPSVARPDTFETFTTAAAVGDSSRALGWDTMRPTSSCGSRMSPRAIGHTGFTGTSLWIDPRVDVYVVLLTNRVHPTRANEAILSVRPALHDAVIDTLS